MLSGESAQGKYPIESIATMRTIIDAAGMYIQKEGGKEGGGGKGPVQIALALHLLTHPLLLSSPSALPPSLPLSKPETWIDRNPVHQGKLILRNIEKHESMTDQPVSFYEAAASAAVQAAFRLKAKVIIVHTQDGSLARTVAKCARGREGGRERGRDRRRKHN
jgi:hypothetical protein